ncbi:MAG: ABC transporter ATP-binding protein [Candidatus Vogelbacteria bacterium]|nr:ABC transporter ATP-binding protein [Candidatus Vogelbacteria bacterium]
MSVIIEIKNISKCYSINRSNEYYTALRDVLTNIFKSPWRFLSTKVREVAGYNKKDIFWALKNINFTVEKGEIVGIIGPNGAGKSTLLKILNRITEPTSGEITIHGKISSLLEVGTGFHPELTGRENIFFSGAILGMKRREIVRKFNDIVKFAEMEQFIDTPVKRYSSGMHVRLAFSVAVHMEPDILLIDEVLAVGDISFQKKCLEKIHEVARKDDRTIIFVSHNLDAVQNLCERSVYLEHGEVKKIGPTDQVIKSYLDWQMILDQKAVHEFPPLLGKPYQIIKVVIKNQDGMPQTNLEAGEPFMVEVTYNTKVDEATFWLNLQCVNEHGNIIFFSRDTDRNPELMTRRSKGRHVSTFTFPANQNVSLNNGRYFLTIRIHQDPDTEVTVPIKIEDTRGQFGGFPGVVLVGQAWHNNEKLSL